MHENRELNAIKKVLVYIFEQGFVTRRQAKRIVPDHFGSLSDWVKESYSETARSYFENDQEAVSLSKFLEMIKERGCTQPVHID